MPDPWVEGDALNEHEKAVQDHELTKVAKKLQDQEKDLAKEAEKRREEAAEDPNGLDEVGRVKQSRPAAETGYSQEVASGGQGPLGEAVVEPAGNLDSNLPTQEEVEKEEKKQAKKSESKSDSNSDSK